MLLPESLSHLKVAIVADWLTSYGGAEKVIFDLHKIFPKAPIYTTIYNPKILSYFKSTKVHTSFLQNLPFSKKWYQMYLPLMPYAFESFDFSEYDIVISSSFACAKGILTRPETLHITYCHTPMRYIWDDSHQYVQEHNFPKLIKKLSQPFLHKIRVLDQQTKHDPDLFIANSDFIKNRIQKYYHRDATTIHPGISFPDHPISIQTTKKNYYLAAGRLKPFKRFDLLIETFNRTKEHLIIAGTGEDLNRLKQLNTNPNTEFLGFVSNETLVQLFLNAKAFLFPQIEDFGITPVEAQFFGCPVIAFNQGGSIETILDKKTGIFFTEQTPQSLRQAILQLNKTKFDYQEIHKHALQFANIRFQKQIIEYIQKQLNKS